MVDAHVRPAGGGPARSGSSNSRGRGSTPPTTLVPPPNGTTATPSRAQASSTRRDLGGASGQHHRVRSLVEPTGAQPDQVGISAARSASQAVLGRRPTRRPGPTASATACGTRPARGRSTSLELGRAARARPRRARRAASRALLAQLDPLGGVPPAPPLHGRVVAIVAHVRRPLDPGQRLVQARPVARRIIGEPSRERPRSRSLLSRVTSVLPLSLLEPDLELRGARGSARTACPRSPAPTRSAPRRRAAAAEVGPHALAPLGPEHRRPAARAARSPRTSSTRTVRGHHRGRWCGSETSSQTRSEGRRSAAFGSPWASARASDESQRSGACRAADASVLEPVRAARRLPRTSQATVAAP